MSSRRSLLRASIGVAGLAAPGAMRRAWAQAAPAEAQVALIAPLSGPLARQGIQMRMGASMAIDEINAAGGVKALGGAKMKLIEVDAEDSTEKAKSAAQRLIADYPGVIGGTGAWLSSFTLAVTEVTERAGLPWLTVSYADSITDRGFRYVFQTSLISAKMAETVMPMIAELGRRMSGKPLTRIGVLSNNTAANVTFLKPIRERIAGELGMKLVVDEIYSPPLADPTPVIQPLRAAKPELMLFLPSDVAEDKLLLDSMNSFGLGHGKVPLISFGTHFATAELLNAVGKEELEGAMVVEGNWGARGQEEVIRRFADRTGEKWMNQDSIATYGDILIFKEALERAGVADREKVAAAIRAMDMRDGPAMFYPSRHIKFDAKGRCEDAKVVLVQWQDGVPQAVFPPELATAEPIWPKSG